MDIKTQFHKGIKAYEMMDYVERLAAWGPRHSTSENERKAISYIEEKLKATNTLKVSLQETRPIVNWKEIDSRLRVVKAYRRRVCL